MVQIMSGWRRLGVVLSVLWFVGFGGWLWTSSVRGYQDFYGFELRNCSAMSSMKRDALRADDQQYDQKSAKIIGEEKACTDNADAFFSREIDKLYSQEVWVLLAIDVALLALFWLLAWIVVAVGHWVLAGFRQQA
jgi:hypothetical protein